MSALALVTDAVTQDPAVTVALALLNVVQTVCLAYLAADRRTVNAMRRQKRGTRIDDRVG